MKFLYAIVSVFFILSCSNPTQNKSEVDTISQQATDSIAPLPQDSKNNKWTNNFLELREAIITGDRETVKRFFDFPVISEGNEIWFLANSRLVMEITPEDVKPFTETDFDRYFSSIFAVDLRQTLKQLNVEEFLKEHADYCVKKFHIG